MIRGDREHMSKESAVKSQGKTILMTAYKARKLLAQYVYEDKVDPHIEHIKDLFTKLRDNSQWHNTWKDQNCADAIMPSVKHFFLDNYDDGKKTLNRTVVDSEMFENLVLHFVRKYDQWYRYGEATADVLNIFTRQFGEFNFGKKEFAKTLNEYLKNGLEVPLAEG